MNWRQAFLEQARSDNAVRKLLNDQGKEYSHQLHYLQMTAEKLAKGYESDPDPPRKTHKALVRTLQTIRKWPPIRKQLGCRCEADVHAFIKSVLPLAERLERLAPALAGPNGPNPEYPWKDGFSGEIRVPASFEFEDFNPRKPQMARLVKLLDILLRIVT